MKLLDVCKLNTAGWRTALVSAIFLGIFLAVSAGAGEAAPVPGTGHGRVNERRLCTQAHAATVSERAFLCRTACEEVLPGDVPADAVLNYLRRLAADVKQSRDFYEIAVTARAKAEAARALSANRTESLRWAEEAEKDLAFLDSWLDKYGQKSMVHRRLEPDWINGQPDVVSQAVLAWITLEKVQPQEERRQKITKFCEGLCALLEPDTERYPFGAHISRLTLQGKPRSYTLPDSEDKVAGMSLFAERQYCVSALARAGKLLNNKEFVASACAEASGLMAHLAMLGAVPYDYAPRPEQELESPLATASIVENLADAYLVTGVSMYGDLAGCAAINANSYNTGAVPRAVKSWTRRQLGLIGYTHWIGAADIKPANNGQVIELENGRAVEKSFSVHDIVYPGGTPGQLAVVGRDNMFWMRFDVDREDSYYFHLCFLKRDASGGLVAVQMRIDGDKIFEVSLDGATEDPYVDAELVAGPRLLRQGPHSFGIRFSGLLMRSPAWLDSIMVEPAVQRRWVRFADGSTRIIFNSIADQNIKVRVEELETEGVQGRWQLCTREGRSLEPQIKADRRHRVWLDMPSRSFGELIWLKNDIANRSEG